MFFESSGEVRDGRIAEHDAYIGYTEAFLIKKVARVFHALALIKIKYGCAEQLLESFFQIAFIDGPFATEFTYGQRLTHMIQQNFARQVDLFPVCTVSK